MTPRHQSTREEEAYWRLLDENWYVLSRPARTLFRKAYGVTYADYMVHNLIVGPEDYEKAEAKMFFAAQELTGRDHELLTEIMCAAEAAAASLDPDDLHTIAGYCVYVGNLHDWYKMTAAMLEEYLDLY